MFDGYSKPSSTKQIGKNLILADVARIVVPLNTHLGIRPCAGTPSPCLDPEQVVEERAHVVVVQQQPGLGVADEEGEYRQARRSARTQDDQVWAGGPYRHGSAANQNITVKLEIVAEINFH